MANKPGGSSRKIGRAKKKCERWRSHNQPCRKGGRKDKKPLSRKGAVEGVLLMVQAGGSLLVPPQNAEKLPSSDEGVLADPSSGRRGCRCCDPRRWTLRRNVSQQYAHSVAKESRRRRRPARGG